MAKTNGSCRGIFERPKGSGTWWVRYADQNGKLHREKAGPKGLARELYEKRKTEVREGKFFSDRIGRQRVVLFNELAQDFLDYSRAEKRSLKNDVSRMKPLLKAFGGKPAASVSLADVERFKWDLQQKSLLPATVKHHLDLLRAVYNRAMRLNKVQQNPMKGMKPVKINNSRVRYLTDAEEARLFVALPKHLHPIVELALLTGLRRSNLLGLEWKNVDLVAGVYTIPISKSGEALRLPFHPRALEILAGLPKNGPYVFPKRNGKPRRAIDSAFRKAVRRAAIPNFKYHDLRHTWASRLAMAGVDLVTIKELGGWKTLKMVLRYAHLSPTHLREELGRLPAPRTGTSTDTVPKQSSGERSEDAGNHAETKGSEAGGNPA